MDEYDTVALHAMDENSLAYFAECYPEEYDAYVDDMAELAHYDDVIEMPEDWYAISR